MRSQAEDAEACPLCFKLVQGRAPKVSRKRPLGDGPGARSSMPTAAATTGAAAAVTAAATVPATATVGAEVPAQSPRTERARRWDHLRKTHGITTCDKCSLRLHKDMYYQHSIQCCDSGYHPGGASRDSRRGMLACWAVVLVVVAVERSSTNGVRILYFRSPFDTTLAS
jgi:hypothetical protein